MTINGAGADVLALGGNATSRVFQTVTGAKTVSISGLTIRNGQSGFGGSILNAGIATLTITNSTFSGNAAADTGGGVFNIGTLQLANGTVSDNSAAFLAGGVLNFNNLEIGNTILNRGASGVSIYSNGDGLVTSLGYNI